MVYTMTVQESNGGPRAWTAVAVAVAALPLAHLAMATWPVGVVPGLAAGQGALMVLALGAAWRSEVALPARLGLVRPVLGVGPLLLAVLATVALSFLADQVGRHAFDDLGGAQAWLRQRVSGATMVEAIEIAVWLTLAPAVAEELVFRGYVQTRLLQTWSAPAAIAFTAVAFAALHVDPVHVVMVLPVGLWLGVLAWRARSVWPAVLAHAVNNLLATLEARIGGPDGHLLDALGGGAQVAVWVGAAGLVGVAGWALARAPPVAQR